MPSSLLALLCVAFVQKEVEPGRVFKAGQIFEYSAKSQITIESRQLDLQTFIPEDVEQSYNFTLEIQKLKADGIAQAIYKRPTFNITIGDTEASAAKKTVMKVNTVLQLDLSPINEPLEIKDLSPKDPKKKDAQRVSIIRPEQSQSDAAAIGIVMGYGEELIRMATFMGPFDAALDLAPRMSLDPVKPGDTWKRTVSYTPQKLQGKKDEQAVQRLDYLYTYVGRTKNAQGKEIEKMTAELSVNTDLGAFATQLIKNSLGEPLLKQAPAKYTAKIDFELDPKTWHTLRAVANASGSIEVILKGSSQPIIEQRFKGRTILKLESLKEKPAPKPKKS